MAKTYLELRDGTSNKFWEVTVEGSRHTVRFGRIGTDGQTKTKTFRSPDLARADAESLIRSKTKKGYSAPGGSAPKAKAPAKKDGGSGMVALVDALLAAQVARAEADGEKVRRPKLRPPATAKEIAEVERAWGRPLPPTYRAFLEVTNGIGDELGTHRLLGTGDQKWGKKQVAAISEFWDDYDATKEIPVAVPEGGMGIRNFAAFAPGKAKGDEVPIVDWDDGAALKKHASFEAYLRWMVDLEERVAKSTAADKKAGEVRATELAEARAKLTSKEAVASRGPARAAAFEAIFELDDVAAARAAVEKLVSAKPSADELGAYFDALDHDLQVRSAPCFARAELVFHPKLSVPKPLRASWVRTMNDAMARAFETKDVKRSERWANVARPHARSNESLGHNLACAYVAAGRLDDAFEMCKAAVAAGYPRLAQMRTDKDLGPLLGEKRFQALFGPADSVDASARTSIPRNAALEAEVSEGKSVAKYAAWLTKEGSRLGAVAEADLAAMKVPQKKKAARAIFAAYVKDVLAPAFPAIAGSFEHAIDGGDYISFRYGLLEVIDTFRLGSAKERKEALALLADPHAMLVKHVCMRGAKLDSFELFGRLRHLRQIQSRWTDITQVDSLAPLAGLTRLRALNISNSKVKDLRPIAKLPLLQLYANATRVTDLSPLAKHPTLSHLTIQDTKVADISPLLTCPKLCAVDLWDVKIDRAQLEKLVAYLDKAKNKYVADDAIMDGYDRGVSHADT